MNNYSAMMGPRSLSESSVDDFITSSESCVLELSKRRLESA